jgi:hypothetical protein
VSAAFIIRADGETEIDFDGVESETHPDLATVTEHPVEVGVNIVDHVRLEPAVISLSVIVSNTPLRGGNTRAISYDLPKREPPFDGSPGALFREAKALFASDPGPLVVQAKSFPAVDRIALIQGVLDEIRLASELVAVVTMSRTYYDCVLTRSELQRSKFGSAIFGLDFRKVDIVATQNVAAPVPLEPRGAPKISKGSQAAKDAKDVDAKKVAKSVSADIMDSILSLRGS